MDRKQPIIHPKIYTRSLLCRKLNGIKEANNNLQNRFLIVQLVDLCLKARDQKEILPPFLNLKDAKDYFQTLEMANHWATETQTIFPPSCVDDKYQCHKCFKQHYTRENPFQI